MMSRASEKLGDGEMRRPNPNFYPRGERWNIHVIDRTMFGTRRLGALRRPLHRKER